MGILIYDKEQNRLYSDSRAVQNGTILTDATQKIFKYKDSIVGVISKNIVNLSDVDYMVRDFGVTDVLAILITEDGTVKKYNSTNTFETITVKDDFIFLGDGVEIALGAKEFTKDPRKIIEAVIKNNAYCGGKIQSMGFKYEKGRDE